MNLNITFRHMEHTPALDQVIREKSLKFTKWLGPQVNVRWTCWPEGSAHYSEVTVLSGSDKFFAKACADDMYKTFDRVIHKIQNQMS